MVPSSTLPRIDFMVLSILLSLSCPSSFFVTSIILIDTRSVTQTTTPCTYSLYTWDQMTVHLLYL